MSTDDILKQNSIFTIVRGSISVADTSPLAGIIAKYVDEEMLKAIAEEHSKGRRLYIATTNLDAHRSVIWNLGAIAFSGPPDALQLIHEVMLCIRFNTCCIPATEFVPNPKEPFDSDEMNRLYDLAYKMGKSGYPWQKFPTRYHD